MTRVVLAESLKSARRDLGFERSMLGAGVELVQYACDGDEDRLIAACKDADVVLTAYSPMTRNVIEQLSQCELISITATGFGNVDLEAAADAGIRVCAVDEYCTDEVADHAVLLMLALCRRLPEYHQQVQVERQWQFDSLSGLSRMRDLTLGIVGFGRIGQAVARRAQGFGLAIMAFDPYPNDELIADLDARYCTLEALYCHADIVSLNCGLTADNQHLVDKGAFEQMKRKPLIINCARGALIDEEAMVNALDTGQISGAGLDVLDDESPDLSSSKLIGRKNVILTPHVAFYSDASVQENRRISTANVRNFLDGKDDDVRRFVL
ncbi:MAG: C-terminal binding protein [Arenicellales bacterium]|nr:C-terminal binding protein [Arenicellales bacterium]